MLEVLNFKEIGDNAKHFEKIQAGLKLDPTLPIIARLDGRSFHRFTSGMPRPFCANMSKCMIETAKYLVAETNPCFAYTQSDEITLVFFNKENSTVIFDAKIQKLTSTLASLATAKFNQQVALLLPERAHLLPTFDARVFNVPDLAEAANCVLFRTLDCQKNSVTMAASAYFSHKELQRKSTTDKLAMLSAKSINFDDFPHFFKYGTFLMRKVVEKQLSKEELSKIPAKFKPASTVLRTVVEEVNLPPFHLVENKIEVLFHKVNST